MVLAFSYKQLSVLLSVCMILLAGCTIGSPEESVAHKTVEEFYQAINQQDVDKALAYFSSDRSPEQWRSHLEHVQKSLGEIEKFTLRTTEVNTVLSGRYYILEYVVTYDSGKVANEVVVLFDTVETDDMPLIVSRVISADGYQPLF